MLPKWDWPVKVVALILPVMEEDFFCFFERKNEKKLC
jgi:hypothetical protein